MAGAAFVQRSPSRAASAAAFKKRAGELLSGDDDAVEAFGTSRSERVDEGPRVACSVDMVEEDGPVVCGQAFAAFQPVDPVGDGGKFDAHAVGSGSDGRDFEFAGEFARFSAAGTLSGAGVLSAVEWVGAGEEFLRVGDAVAVASALRNEIVPTTVRPCLSTNCATGSAYNPFALSLFIFWMEIRSTSTISITHGYCRVAVNSTLKTTRARSI